MLYTLSLDIYCKMQGENSDRSCQNIVVKIWSFCETHCKAKEKQSSCMGTMTLCLTAADSVGLHCLTPQQKGIKWIS